MSYIETKGNIFNSIAQTLVNTVNCVGVMGKGVAFEFRLRYPDMFEEYRVICSENKLKPGQILPYRKNNPWILNFAVKNDWKAPSRIEWVESCLQRFVYKYRELGVTSIAFPWMGAMNGGLPWEKVHELMRNYLSPLPDIKVEVIEFDPDISDPVFNRLRDMVSNTDLHDFAKMTGLKTSASALIYEAIAAGRATSMFRVCLMDGIGKLTIEKLYAYFRAPQKQVQNVQHSLFYRADC